VPPQLLTYRPEDWPLGCHPECSFWEAVFAFTDDNPDIELPGNWSGPDTPFHPELI